MMRIDICIENEIFHRVLLGLAGEGECSEDAPHTTHDTDGAHAWGARISEVSGYINDADDVEFFYNNLIVERF